jgi:hypothetical protein
MSRVKLDIFPSCNLVFLPRFRNLNGAEGGIPKKNERISWFSFGRVLASRLGYMYVVYGRGRKSAQEEAEKANRFAGLGVGDILSLTGVGEQAMPAEGKRRVEIG